MNLNSFGDYYGDSQIFVLQRLDVLMNVLHILGSTYIYLIEESKTRLLHVVNRNSKLRFLVDIGSEVSVIPPSAEKRYLQATGISLLAANNTKIPRTAAIFQTPVRMESSVITRRSLRQRPTSKTPYAVPSGDFAVEDRHGGGDEKGVEDAELEVILSEDSCQIKEELSESLGGYE
nr:Mariner Mos1 transposase [Hymenolepis microstoma]